jgi:hypothetical protein
MHASLFKGADDVLKAYIPDFEFIFKNLHNLEDSEIKMLQNQQAHLGILTMARAFKEKLLEDLDNAYIYLEIDSNDPDVANFIHQLIVYILSLKHGDYESVKKELIRIKSPIKSSIMSIAEQLINHGVEKGINQGIELERVKKDEEIAIKTEETTIKLILSTGFDDLQIAELLDVTEEYVSELREKIKTENVEDKK